jgi:hypothetical protein
MVERSRSMLYFLADCLRSAAEWLEVIARRGCVYYITLWGSGGYCISCHLKPRPWAPTDRRYSAYAEIKYIGNYPSAEGWAYSKESAMAVAKAAFENLHLGKEPISFIMA